MLTARAWVQRPSRARTVAIAALAIVLVVTLLVADQHRHHRPRRSALPPLPTAPVAAPVPYLVGGRTLYLGTQVIGLPAGWSAIRALTSAAGVVLEVNGPGGQFAALASGDGTIQRLTQVQPPLAVTASGTLLAGTAPAQHDELVLVSLPDQVVIDRIAISEAQAELDILGSADGADDFLVVDNSQALIAPRYLLWRPQQHDLSPLSGQVDAGAIIALAPGGGWYSLGPGTFFVSLVRHAGSGRALWGQSLEWPSASVPQLSPDGSRLVVDSSTTGSVRYVDARTGLTMGATNRVSADVPFSGGDAPIWLDDRTVLVSRLLGSHGSALYRCLIGVPDCSLLVRSPGRIMPAEGPWSSPSG